jgi:hypothetical protein
MMIIYTLGDGDGEHVVKKVHKQLASFAPCMFATMLGRSIKLSLSINVVKFEL